MSKVRTGHHFEEKNDRTTPVTLLDFFVGSGVCQCIFARDGWVKAIVPSPKHDLQLAAMANSHREMVFQSKIDPNIPKSSAQRTPSPYIIDIKQPGSRVDVGCFTLLGRSHPSS